MPNAPRLSYLLRQAQLANFQQLDPVGVMPGRSALPEWAVGRQRQHVHNGAFREARQALDNVLKLKPNETDALKLVAEISRREQDITSTREKKKPMTTVAR